LARQTQTRERLVQTAGELFWRQGYAATGVNEIIKRARATSGSFYHFFATKDELLLAVINRVGETLSTDVLDPAEVEGSPLDRVRSMAARYAECLSPSGPAFGFPVGSLVGELGTEHGRARERVVEHFEGWVARVEGWLTGMTGSGGALDDGREVAEFIVSALEGSAVQCRARGELASVQVCIGQLDRWLEDVVEAPVSGIERVGGTDVGDAGTVDWKAW
jgi:TetR/AcrR family transcriptional repressor of lmrAB and yxaGH operons